MEEAYGMPNMKELSFNLNTLAADLWKGMTLLLIETWDQIETRENQTKTKIAKLTFMHVCWERFMGLVLKEEYFGK